jgi:hypothetical protein
MLSRDEPSQKRVGTEQGLSLEEVDGETDMVWAEELREAVPNKS